MIRKKLRDWDFIEDDKEWNAEFSDKTEPGSTMKPFTMLLALDKGIITATDDELIDDILK